MSTAYRRPADVAVVVDPLDGGDATVYLARLPDGPILVLLDTAAAIWQAATEPPDDDATSVRDRVARRWPDAEIGAHVEQFLAELVQTGLLEARER